MPDEKVTMPNIEELGATGTVRIFGTITPNEYQLDLRTNRNRIRIYDRVRRDPDVAFSLSALELSLRTATKDVEAGEDTPEGNKIAESVRKWLFRDLETSWNNLYHHAMLGTVYGHMLFEPDWIGIDSEQFPRRLLPRLPLTILRWLPLEGDDFDGVTQQVLIGSAYKEVDLLVEEKKAWLLTWNMEGSDFQGESICRPIYGPWYRKTKYFEKFWTMYLDRFGVGTPAGFYPKDTPPEQIVKLENILKAWKSGAYNYFIGPDGTRIEFPMPMSMRQDFLDACVYCQQQIARVFFTHAQYLGTDGQGSLALGRTQSKGHGVLAQAVADWIAENFDVLIKWYVDLNHGPQEFYPKLILAGVKGVDVKTTMDALKVAADAGFVMEADPMVVQHVRDLLGLADIDDRLKAFLEAEMDKLKARAEKPDVDPEPPPLPPQPGSEGANPEAIPGQTTDNPADNLNTEAAPVEKQAKDDKQDGALWRDMTFEEKEFNKPFEVRAVLNSNRDALQNKGFLYEAAAKEVIAEAAAAGKDMETFKVPAKLVKPFEKEITITVDNMFDFGGERYRSELLLQGIPEKELVKSVMKQESFDDALAATEEQLTITIGDKISAINGRLTTEASKSAALHVTLEGADKLNAILGDLANLSDAPTEQMMSELVNLGHGKGRDMEGLKQEELVAEEIYSAILDSGTCEVCVQLDGARHLVGDPLYLTPNVERCQGSDRCRCQNIPVAK